MPTKCSICARETDLPAISDLIDAQVPLKEIAAQFHCSPSALSRHIARHRNPVVPEAEGAGGDLQSKSDLLWSRSNQVWELATADTDLRSQISSIQTGLRSLELQAKQRERDQAAQEEKGSGLIDDQGRLSIGVVSELSEWWERNLDDQQKKSIERAAQLESELRVSDGSRLFETMRTDPILREAVLKYAFDFQLARKEKNENESELIQESSAAPNRGSRAGVRADLRACRC
jgi:hypothetical protein